MTEPSTSRRLVAGNWKMNLEFGPGVALARALAASLADAEVPVVVCPPATHLNAVAEAVADAGAIAVGAQDLSRHGPGAHTGELSGAQLKSAGCSYVIVGHSERRSDHRERGELLREKVDRALAADLTPIYCFGEQLDDREGDRAEEVVTEQLSEGLSHLDSEGIAGVVLAYEPVWAIGTGVTASPEQAQAMHAFVRRWLAGRFGEARAEGVTILYGGSVKPANAADLFARTDIDGALVGGASLAAEDFAAIVQSFA